MHMVNIWKKKKKSVSYQIVQHFLRKFKPSKIVMTSLQKHIKLKHGKQAKERKRLKNLII